MVIDDPQFGAFEWDEAKRQANLRKHDIDFVAAGRALRQPHVQLASRYVGEHRMRAVCATRSGMWLIVFTQRGDVTRIISARKANRSERREYQAIYDR